MANQEHSEPSLRQRPQITHPNGLPNSGFTRHSSRYRQISRSAYFGGHTNNLSAIYNRSVPLQQNVKTYNTKLSRHLPPWAWYIIASCLGIRRRWRWLGLLFFALTILLAAMYLITFSWYTVKDVRSHYTKSTALSGTLSVLLAFFWCTMGIYSNRLAKKLFRARGFVDSVRLHSKRIMKVSGSLLLALLALVIVGLNTYGVLHDFDTHSCANISVPEVVCPLLVSSHIGYSVLNVTWNLLVGTVMLSVCRTHTIGIRRFIKELEEDGRIYEELCRQQVLDQYAASGIHVAPAQQQNPDDDEERHGTAEEYLNELNSDQSDNDSVDENGDDGDFDYPLPSTVYEKIAFTRGTSFRQRRRLHASRLSFRGSQSSLASSNVPSQYSSYQPGFSNPAFGAAGQLSNPRRTLHSEGFATIHSQECLDDVRLVDDAVTGEGTKDTEPLVQLDEERARPPQPNTAKNMQPKSPVATPKIQKPDVTTSKRDSGEIEEAAEGSEDGEEENDGNSTVPPPSHHEAVEENMMLSNDEILLAYFKIHVRLCSSSLALQRWLTMWISFILCWAAMFLIELVGAETRLVDIAQFVLSILVIPLLCSAYGEVNYESKRMIRRICPAPWRVEMLFYMDQMPLQMTAYGSPISYGVITTTVGALGLAFFTKMVLTDVNWTD